MYSYLNEYIHFSIPFSKYVIYIYIYIYIYNTYCRKITYISYIYISNIVMYKYNNVLCITNKYLSSYLKIPLEIIIIISNL